MPNPNTIPWLHYQDLQIPDIALKQAFDIYMNNNQFATALRFLNNNNLQLQGKAYIADVINRIINGVLFLENKYTNGVTIFLSTLAQQYFALVNNFKNRQLWSSRNEYEPYNFVLYKDGIYMCFDSPPIGTLPTNETYWLKIGLRGEDGANGYNVTMKYDWSTTSKYIVNDLVIHKEKIWVALNQNTNVEPGTDNNTWIVFVEYEKAQIYVSNVAPNKIDNAIWFQVDVDPLTYNNTEPLIGQFKKYSLNQDIWEDMYPNTIFSWVVGTESFSLLQYYDEVTIKQNDWNNMNEWEYIKPLLNIKEDSMVFILPSCPMTQTQLDIYSNLSLDLTNNVIKLIASKDYLPTVDINLRIIIQ